MFWSLLPAAFAVDVYVNETLVDPRSIANLAFEKVTVRVDASGNLHIDAPGYRIQVLEPAPAAAAPGALGSPPPPAGGVASARWWLVTEDAGTTGHTIQIYVNGKLAYTVGSGQPQRIVDVGRWLQLGPNKVRILSDSVNPGGGSFYVYLGTGSDQSGTVVLDNPIVQFGVGTNRSGPYEREFDVMVDR